MDIFINLNINSLYHKDILGPLGCVLPNSSKSTTRTKFCTTRKKVRT